MNSTNLCTSGFYSNEQTFHYLVWQVTLFLGHAVPLVIHLLFRGGTSCAEFFAFGEAIARRHSLRCHLRPRHLLRQPASPKFTRTRYTPPTINPGQQRHHHPLSPAGPTPTGHPRRRPPPSQLRRDTTSPTSGRSTSPAWAYREMIWDGNTAGTEMGWDGGDGDGCASSRCVYMRYCVICHGIITLCLVFVEVCWPLG